MSAELLNSSPEVKLYPGVINETINRALGMEALFAAFDGVLAEEE